MNCKKSPYSYKWWWLFIVISVVVYVGVLIFVGLRWNATMFNGGPGIASDMLLSDRSLRNTQFRRTIMWGYFLLGVFACVSYGLYWHSQYLEFDEINLKKFSKEFRTLLINAQLSVSLFFVQNTFVFSPSVEAVLRLPIGFLEIGLGLYTIVAMVLEIKYLSFPKPGKSQTTLDEKYSEISRAMERPVYKKKRKHGVLVVFYAALPIISAVVALVELISQFIRIADLLPGLFVSQPYMLVTPYDYWVAYGIPLLACLLLSSNLKYNAPPKIGMPYEYGKLGNVYTCVTLKKELKGARAA